MFAYKLPSKMNHKMALNVHAFRAIFSPPEEKNL